MDSITEKERDVAEIMRNLPKLIRRFRHRVPCCKAVWGAKKKRSSINRKPHRLYVRISSSSPPQPPTPMETETTASGGLLPKPKTNTKKSSPSSPLCFYPSAGENTDAKAGVASASPRSPRRSKRIKIQNKEWIREQNSAISVLSEEKTNLQQEAADFRKIYESLYLENTQLKETKLKAKKKMEEEEEADRHRHLHNVGEQQRRRRKPHVFPSAVVPMVGPTPPTNIGRPQLLPVEPEAPTAPPPSHDRHRHPHPGNNVSPQFWSVSGGESWMRHTGLPDLNATVDESGFVVMDQTPMVVVMDQMRWPDAKKLATTEARKKRIEINRRKAASTAASHRIGVSSIDR